MQLYFCISNFSKENVKSAVKIGQRFYQKGVGFSISALRAIGELVDRCYVHIKNYKERHLIIIVNVMEN